MDGEQIRKIIDEKISLYLRQESIRLENQARIFMAMGYSVDELEIVRRERSGGMEIEQDIYPKSIGHQSSH